MTLGQAVTGVSPSPTLARRVVPALRRRENWQQLLRFAAVGASGYAVNLAIFSIAVLAIGVGPHIAAVLAFCVAVLNNFMLNRLWTFDATGGPVGRQASRFFTVSLGGLALNVLILDLVVRGTEVDPIAAQALAVAMVLPVNYLGQRVWTFSPRSSSPANAREQVREREHMPRACVSLLLGIAAVAAAALLAATPDGVVITSDSVAFLDAAENLAGGQGLVLDGSYTNLEPTIRGRSSFPMVHWAPLYPAALALGNLLQGDTLQAARLLQSVLLAANIGAIGALLWALTKSRGATVAGAALFVISPAGLTRHSHALSEPLFLLLLLVGLELLARHLLDRRTASLVRACVVLALALLARYAGVPVLAVLCGGLLFLGAGTEGGRRRAARAALAGAAVALPLVLWLVHNTAQAGTATGRNGVHWHPPGAGELAGAAGAVVHWFAPSSGPEAARALVACVVVGTLIWGIARAPKWASTKSTFTPEQAVRLELLLAFMTLYLGFLLLSRSLADAANPLNDRGLAPLYVTALPVAVLVVSRALQRASTRSASALAVWSAVAAVSVAYAQQTVSAIPALVTGEAAGTMRPEGYLGLEWRQSPTVALAQATNPSMTIYSNAPDALFMLTGRSVRTIPVRIDPISAQPNDGYVAAVAALRAQVRSGSAVVAWFDGVDRGYLPDLADLRAEVGLQVRSRAKDGMLLTAASTSSGAGSSTANGS